MELIYWPVCSTSRKGGDWVKEVDGEYRILAIYEFHFIRINKIQEIINLLKNILKKYKHIKSKHSQSYIKEGGNIGR